MNDLYQRLLEFTRDGVYRYTFADGRLLTANRGLLEILDLDGEPEQIVGRPLHDLLIYTEREGSVRQAMESHGEIRDFEYHFKTLKGSDRWVLHNSRLVDDPQLGERVVEAIVRDITARKQAELELERLVAQRTADLRRAHESLSASEVRYRALFEESPVALWEEDFTAVKARLDELRKSGVTDFVAYLEAHPETVAECASRVKVLDVNRAALELYEAGSKDELLAGIDKTFTDPSRAVFLRELAGFACGATQFEAEVPTRTLTGKDNVVALRVSVARGYEESFGKVLASLSDITEKKRAEERLKRILELERSNTELEQFAYVASHDLQEPLRMVTSYVKLLERRYKGRLDKDADEFIGFAADGAARMRTLINDLLSYSRLSTRAQPFEKVDCNAALAAALGNLRLAIEESRADVAFEALPEVMADAVQLVQLFQNLVSNAVKFRREEIPRVRISAGRKDGDWLFAVADNGIGIEPEYKERIFLIFQRLHGRGEYSGTGIGLAICRRIVERHGGRIWVESVPGQGSTFFFTIPAVMSNL